tara:strand:- start:7850 stop:11257 length:3408 start_codon:yes stop_codon:yes gene_type:complete
MAFNSNDIYTSSGNVALFNAWTPHVTKFDTSTFYNWEQDNLPLYDLEERTYELWEQQGFTTSAGVPGLALTVSADAPELTLQQNRNIFTDLSSAIAAIPKVVRFPVLVEVGNFGDLGPLELNNFRIEENGSIEIVNRNFSRILNASATSNIAAASPAYNKFIDLCSQLSSADLSATLSDTSCVHIQTPVLSSTIDPRANSNNNFIFYPRIDATNRFAPLHTSFNVVNSTVTLAATANVFGINPFENSVADGTISTLDISGVNSFNDSFLARTAVTDGLNLGGNYYGNKCTKIKVQNCDGPIYIRNFLVNASTGTTQNQNVGIEVNNSKVVLENCASVRNKEAGFKFLNSAVTLSRSAFSYRNYDGTVTTRVAEKGVGFHAINSEITLSSLASSSLADIGDYQASGRDALFVASRNTKGIVLDNSKLTGGVQRTTTTRDTEGALISELNNLVGIELNSSFAYVKGLIDVYGNKKGIVCEGSVFSYEDLTVDGSQEQGVLANNSTLTFDSDSKIDSAYRSQLDFSGNSVHVDLASNSKFSFKPKENAATSYGFTKYINAFGGSAALKAAKNSVLDLYKANILVEDSTNDNQTTFGRGVLATEGSEARLTGEANAATYILGPSTFAKQKSVVGAMADKVSHIFFHGPTAIAQFGVDVLASDNSVATFEPRRLPESRIPDGSFGVSDAGNHTSVELHSTRACIVADNNSTITMKDLGAYAANWGLGPSGAALLEDIAATDAEFATFSSTVSAGSMQFLANPDDITAVNASSLDSIPDAGVTPKTVNTTAQLNTIIFDRTLGLPNYSDSQQFSVGGMCVRALGNSVVDVENVHFPFPFNASPADGLYYDVNGELCDRFGIWNIADQSKLKAKYLSVSGVHPIDGIQHGPSAIYISSVGPADFPGNGAPSGTPDTGTLSILDAFGAGSAVWMIPKGVDVNSDFDRFAPIPDTITVEEARQLGGAGINVSGTETYTFGVSGAYNNRGPFRIYWSPKASAKLLAGGPDLSSLGEAYQIFAQGYNCSAPLSALAPSGEINASGYAPDLLKLSYDSDGDGVPDSLWTSGFYYCAEIIEENPTQCVLEESAADTFANARNASVGLAGRPRKTTIYKADLSRASEFYQGDTITGFRSATVFDLSRDD